MLAQVTLTPTESKKLIAKAVAQMDAVRRAYERGLIVLHPSSSTYFVVEELTGRKPGTNAWVCGIIVPKAACVEMGVFIGDRAVVQANPEKSTIANPTAFRHSWVLRNGGLSHGVMLGDLLDEMGPGDVYVKGGNALDVDGNVGVLAGNAVEGGTIGTVMTIARKKGFQVVLPVGLEKLIPVPLDIAVKAARRNAIDLGMGIPCSLVPCYGGMSVTEVKAIEMLSGARAIPIAAGGLGGAEGSITLVLEGDEAAVRKAFDYVERSKGAQLPQVRVHNCHQCGAVDCRFPVGDKAWAAV